MHALTNSAFLQSLGYAIANSLWQAALVWVLLFAITSFVKLSPASKYRFAVTAQLTVLVWFLSTCQFYYTACTNAFQQSSFLSGTQHIQLMAPADPVGFNAYLLQYIIKAEQLLSYLSIAYLAVLIVLIVKWFTAYKYTKHISSNGLLKINIDYKLFTINVAEQLGIKKEVKIYLSNIVKSPLTTGFLKPLILIPAASINNLTTQQLEAVILHELAHIKRYDYLVNIGLSLTEMALFFNPFTYLISKTIKKERENSCDDWVLQFQYNAATYAQALLQIAYMQLAPSLAMAAADDKTVLLSRVRRMIEQKEKKINYRTPLLALLLLTLAISTASLINVPKQSNIAKANFKQVMAEPMAISIDNPLFSPVFFLRKPLQKEVEKNREQIIASSFLKATITSSTKNEYPIITIIPAAIKNTADMINDEQIFDDDMAIDKAAEVASIYTIADKNFTIENLPTIEKNKYNVFEGLGKMFEQFKNVQLQRLNVSNQKAIALKDLQKQIVVKGKASSTTTSTRIFNVTIDSFNIPMEEVVVTGYKTPQHDEFDAIGENIFPTNYKHQEKINEQGFSYEYVPEINIAIAKGKDGKTGLSTARKVKTYNISTSDSTGQKNIKITITSDMHNKKNVTVEVIEKRPA